MLLTLRSWTIFKVVCCLSVTFLSHSQGQMFQLMKFCYVYKEMLESDMCGRLSHRIIDFGTNQARFGSENKLMMKSDCNCFISKMNVRNVYKFFSCLWASYEHIMSRYGQNCLKVRMKIVIVPIYKYLKLLFNFVGNYYIYIFGRNEF